MMNWKNRICVFGLFVVTSLGLPAIAQDEMPAEGTEEVISEVDQRKAEEYFRSVWRLYANGYTKINDELYLCIGFDRKFDSSRRISIHDWQKKHKFKRSTKDGKTEEEDRDKGEVYAAVQTPKKFAPGHWGYIESMEVVAIEGDNVYVANIGFVDQEKLDKEMARERKSLEKKIRKEYARQDAKSNTTSTSTSTKSAAKKRETREKNIEKDAEKAVEEMFKFRLDAVKHNTESEAKRFLLSGFNGQFRVGQKIMKQVNVRGGYHIAFAQTAKELDDAPSSRTTGSLRQRIRRSGKAEYAIVPVPQLKRGIEQEDFEAMLEQGNITKYEFVQRVREAVKEQQGKIDHVKLAPPIQRWIEMQRAKGIEKEKKEEEEGADEPGPVATDDTKGSSSSSSEGKKVAMNDGQGSDENPVNEKDNAWRGFDEAEGQDDMFDSKKQRRKGRHPQLPANDKNREEPKYDY